MASERRGYVKVPDAILREQWDDSTMADMMRLQAFLNTRWARDRLTADEAGTAFLGPQEMMLITRVQDVRRARKRLLELPERSGCTSLSAREERPGDVPATSPAPSQGRPRDIARTSAGRSKHVRGVRITWDKFVQEQGYKDREPPQTRGNAGVTDPVPQKQPQKQPQVQYVPPPSGGSESAPSDPPPKKRRRKRPPPELPPRTYELAELLIRCLRNEEPDCEPVRGAQIPTRARDNWAKEIALLVKQTPDLASSDDPWTHVEGGIRWAFGDKNVGQYALVIRSGGALREKWSRLVAASQRYEEDPERKQKREWNEMKAKLKQDLEREGLGHVIRSA